MSWGSSGGWKSWPADCWVWQAIESASTVTHSVRDRVNCGRATNYDGSRNLRLFAAAWIAKEFTSLSRASEAAWEHNCKRQCPVTLQTSREFQREKLDWLHEWNARRNHFSPLFCRGVQVQAQCFSEWIGEPSSSRVILILLKLLYCELLSSGVNGIVLAWWVKLSLLLKWRKIHSRLRNTILKTGSHFCWVYLW